MPKFNVRDGIEKYRSSDFLKELREQFLRDEKPKGCSRCWIEEDAGIKSKRQLDYERHKEEFDKIDLKDRDFKNVSVSFGNLCNFACRICSASNSSKWVSENIKNTGKKFPIHDWFKRKDIMEDVFRFTKDAIHFDIPGGEPLLLELPEQFEFLGRFSDQQSQKISIHYTTNGSNFPKKEFLDQWDRFKEIDIQISIDDTGKRFEYNRWPGKWSEVYENIKKLQELEKDKGNVRLSISFTVSAFTVAYAKEFFEWCLSEGLPKPWMGRLNYPYHYCVEILPEVISGPIKEQLRSSEFEDVRNLANYLDGSKKDLLPVFKEKVTELDRFRNQSFVQTFPELVSLMN